MPDHLHALLVFPREAGMSTAIRNWKRAMARLHGIKWQSNYFDHRIRDDKERRETWDYIRRNPVAKGLCASEAEWPFWWSALSPTRMEDGMEKAPLGQGAPPCGNGRLVGRVVPNAHRETAINRR
jgi:hypothetical protein